MVTVGALIKDANYEGIRRRIIDVLETFPRLTRSMLGAQVSPYERTYGVPWADVLDSMVQDGEITTTLVERKRGAVRVYSIAPNASDNES